MVPAETTISNSASTESVPSLAVTFTESVCATVGVPENVRVAGVKVSHEGRAVSSDCGVPENVRVAAAKLSHAGSAESSSWVAV